MIRMFSRKLTEDVTDLGGCDFDDVLYEFTGLCFIERDVDNPGEIEKDAWPKWTKEDYDNALEILSRLSKNALRVREKLKWRRDNFLIQEIRNRCEAQGIRIPNPGDKMYVHSTDDTSGGIATVARVHYEPDCKNEYNQVSVSFEELGPGLTFNIRPLLDEQRGLKNHYGETEARRD